MNTPLAQLFQILQHTCSVTPDPEKTKTEQKCQRFVFDLTF